MSNSNICYYQSSKPSTSTPDTYLTDKIAKRILNKGAEPFIPQTLVSNQNPLFHTNLNINSIPYTYGGSPIESFPQDFSQDKPCQNGKLLRKNFNLIENLEPLIESLRNDPGNLTQTCVSLLTILNCQGNDDNFLKETVEYIVELCLSSDTYHYSCCRLLDYLIHNLPERHGKIFKNHLLNQIQDVTYFYEDKINGNHEEQLGYEIFAYFLADLFIHLEHRYKSPTYQVWSEEKYLPLYIALCNNCDKLIETPGKIKCLFRILKMAGIELSKFETLQIAREKLKGSPLGTNSPAFTSRTLSLFKKIREKLLSNDTSMLDKEYLLKLLELKASEWGQAQSLLQEQASSSYDYVPQSNQKWFKTLDDHDMGLFNITQGEPLTEENILTEDELAFLQDNDMYLEDGEGSNFYLENENEVSINLPPSPLLLLDEDISQKELDTQNYGGDSSTTPYVTPEITAMQNLGLEGENLIELNESPEMYSTPEADVVLQGTPIHYMNDEECKDLEELENSKV